uniref:Metastasis suppressor 1 n=1 Tax=Nothobranchius rachovii TaxID=451742 RepID=A0A1A8SER9_9TELE
MATGARGATKEIGSALTRMCMRHRSIESKLKLFTTALSESLITPLELKMEEWKKDPHGSTNQLTPGGGVMVENGLLPLPHNTYTYHERARAMSASGKSCSARDQLGLTLGVLTSDAPRSSRDSLHCSSGYSTQTTTPSCSEDTIHTHTVRRDPPSYADYESISLHGDADSVFFHHLSHGSSQSDFDKSLTMPRNSDLKYQYKEFAQSKRPASTVSLLAEAELSGSSGRQLPPHTATIRRKPSSKPAYRRGTISGGVPIPICTPQVPLKAFGGNSGSDENVFKVPAAGGVGGLSHSKLSTSTQSLSALPSSSSSSSFCSCSFIPGQMPIPVPVPTVPSLPPEGGSIKQQQQRQQLLQQQVSQQQQQLHMQQQFQHQQVQVQQQFQQQQLFPHPLQLQQQVTQQINHLHLQQQRQQHQHQPEQQQNLQLHHQENQQQLNQLQKHRLFQEQHQVQMQGSATRDQPSSLDHSTNHQLQAPPTSSQEAGGGGRDMQTLIRSVKLRRTITNDRSAPLLPTPANYK